MPFALCANGGRGSLLVGICRWRFARLLTVHYANPNSISKEFACRNFEHYLIVMMRYADGKDDRDFRKGKKALAGHRPDLALRSFRASVDDCPAAEPERLSRNLYWLALALLRLDRPELAIRSLASAQKLRPRGIARAAYLHRINEYGMCRRSSRELDDFYAFYSVQACAYLGRKPGGRFDSNAEKDAVTKLIGDSWKALSGSGKLAKLTAAQKLAVFKASPIAFPLFGLESEPRGSVIPADFRRGRRLRGDDRCSCGSGLPFMRCCGRTSSLRERSCE
jgi:hypothetical protein